MLGHFAVCPMNTVCIRSLAPRSCVAAASCRTRRLCALCISPFLSIRSALTLMPVPIPDPPFPLFFLLLRTRPPSRLPCRAHPLISSPLFPIRSLVQGAHHGRVYPHRMDHLCSPSLSPPLTVCCAPPPFITIRSPWSLLFFSIPIPLAFRAELRNLVDIVKPGSSVRGDGVI